MAYCFPTIPQQSQDTHLPQSACCQGNISDGFGDGNTHVDARHTCPNLLNSHMNTHTRYMHNVTPAMSLANLCMRVRHCQTLPLHSLSHFCTPKLIFHSAFSHNTCSLSGSFFRRPSRQAYPPSPQSSRKHQVALQLRHNQHLL